MKKVAPGAPDAGALLALVRKHDDWGHLAVRARGRFLTLLALHHQDDDGQPLARLERLELDEYRLCIMWHNDKWQHIPVSGRLEQIVGCGSNSTPSSRHPEGGRRRPMRPAPWVAGDSAPPEPPEHRSLQVEQPT
jgi:hypothetical protein